MVLGASILETVSQVLEARASGRTVVCIETWITSKSRRCVFLAGIWRGRCHCRCGSARTQIKNSESRSEQNLKEDCGHKSCPRGESWRTFQAINIREACLHSGLVANDVRDFDSCQPQ